MADPMQYSTPDSTEMRLAEAWLKAYAERIDLHGWTKDQLLAMKYVVAAYATWRKGG